MESNVISFSLTADEQAKITAAANEIFNIIKAKLPDLSAEKRRFFGSINEQNKLLVNKARDITTVNPTQIPPEVNWTEFESDYKARTFYEGVLLIINNITSRLESAKMMHDYDNYNDALVLYRYLDYLRRSDVPGAEVSYNALREFFPRAKKSNSTKPDDTKK
jgi:hypothetical protein